MRASPISKFALRGALTAALLAAGPAYAQSRAPSDEWVTQVTEFARANISRARLEDGSNVPPETPEELAQPIPRATEIAAIRRGELSGQMQHCGLDWDNQSYRPFMQRLRAGGWRGKRMAYVGLLHGLSQGATTQSLEDAEGGCGAHAVAAMRAEAASLGDLL